MRNFINKIRGETKSSAGRRGRNCCYSLCRKWPLTVAEMATERKAEAATATEVVAGTESETEAEAEAETETVERRNQL